MTCSFAWDDAGLPVWGTAPRADFWVAVQQDGPWGATAFTQSRLDPIVGAAIESTTSDAGGRALLIRRPASHADHGDHPLHQVFIAGGLAGTPWLLGGLVPDLDLVLNLPWGDVAADDPAELLASVQWLERLDRGVLLVCANAKRDLCCALRGRPIALALEAEAPGRVWECTHIGGHRFAPAGLMLPSGQSLGRLTPEVARAALKAADAGRLAAETFGPWHDRGRGHLPPACAVAEAYVRVLTGETDASALVARWVATAGESAESGQIVQVQHADGRRWCVTVSEAEYAEQLPESCAKPPVAAHSWVAQLSGLPTAEQSVTAGS